MERGEGEMAENVIELTDAEFKAKVVDSGEKFVVDFWAPWCGPCQMVGPIVEELAAEYAGKVSFGKLNVDAAQATAGEYGVMSIPTLLVFSGGKEAKRIIGAQQKDALKAQIDSALGL